MTSRQRRRWLDDELPRLIEAGIVAPDVGARIRAHYAELGRDAAGVSLLGVLGALLIGLGAISLVAANWELLSTPQRTLLCFALLVGAQAVAAFAVFRRPDSVAWLESTGIGLVLAVAAALALISQTYQIQGDLRAFLTSVLALSLPVLYFTRSRAAAVLYLVGTLLWLASGLSGGDAVWPWWLFTLPLAPFAREALGEHEARLRNRCLAAAAVVALTAGALGSFRVESAATLLAQGAVVIAGLYALGASGGRNDPAVTARALSSVALAAAVLVFGYGPAWGFVGEAIFERQEQSAIDRLGSPLVLMGFGAMLLIGLRRLLAQGECARALLALFPLVFGLGIAAVAAGDMRDHWPDFQLAASLGMTLYGLLVGLGLAHTGLARADLPAANFGLLLIGAVVFTRFSDWDLSFTLRGLIFIGFGLAFWLLNLEVRRRQRGPR